MSFINNFVLITGMIFILYYTDKTDGARMVLCYPISYALSIPCSAIFLIGPVRKMWKSWKEDQHQEEELENLEKEGGDLIEAQGEGFIDPLSATRENSSTERLQDEREADAEIRQLDEV